MRSKGSLFQIAIDGPVGAGKSTVAARLAEKLGVLYVDTGAMYRGVAWLAKKQGISWEDEKRVSELVKKMDLRLEPAVKRGERIRVFVNGKEVSEEIRRPEIGEGASVVSQYPVVREVLVAKQQAIAKQRSVVMEGRDIGTRVLPDATLKIYMDADLVVRAKRKWQELVAKGEKISLKEVEEGIIRRDTREMTRKIDPLRKAKGAWEVDTSHLSVEEVVDKIRNRLKGRLNEKK